MHMCAYMSIWAASDNELVLGCTLRSAVRAPRGTRIWESTSQVDASIRKIRAMLIAAKEENFSRKMVWTDECVFPLAASGVYPKTRVWGSSEKMLHCFSATAPLSGNSRMGWENSSGKTALGSALDNNGNTTSKTDSTGTTNYSWDFENRLTQVTLPGTGGTVSFKYDPFGRRIYKSSSTATSIYAYDGDNLIEETNSSGAVVARYSQGLSIDEPLAMLRSGTTSYYNADGLGSITSLANGAGALAQTYTFDSFGKQTASSGSLTNPFRYTGREFDAETSLYFYRARYYDPSGGRFISEDPAGFSAGIDFYVYVSNNSTNLFDPNGLLQLCCRSAHQFIFQSWALVTLQPKPCHCFLKLSDGTTLGGYFSKKLSDPGGLGNLVRGLNDKTDHDTYAKEAKCSDVPGKPCENDERARKAFGLTPPVYGQYGVGAIDAGTSNDAAAGLLKDAGLNSTLPLCAWGKNAGYTPFGPGRFFPSRPPLLFKNF
jgi:RHS repeat-associated protein